MIEANFLSNNNPSEKITLSYHGKGLSFLMGDQAKYLLDVLKQKNLDQYSGSVIFESTSGKEELLCRLPEDGKPKISIIEVNDFNVVVTRSLVTDRESIDSYDADVASEKYLSIYDVDEELNTNFKQVFRNVYEELSAKGWYVVIDLSGTRRTFAYAIVDLLGKIMKTYPIFVYAPSLFGNMGKRITVTQDPEKLLRPETPDVSESGNLTRSLAMTSVLETLDLEEPKANQNPFQWDKEKILILTATFLSILALAMVITLFCFDALAGLFIFCIFAETVLEGLPSGILIYINSMKKQKHIYQNKFFTASLIITTICFSGCTLIPMIIWIARLRNYDSYYYILPSLVGLANILILWGSMYFGNHVFFGSPNSSNEK